MYPKIWRHCFKNQFYWKQFFRVFRNHITISIHAIIHWLAGKQKTSRGTGTKRNTYSIFHMPPNFSHQYIFSFLCAHTPSPPHHHQLTLYPTRPSHSFHPTTFNSSHTKLLRKKSRDCPKAPSQFDLPFPHKYSPHWHTPTRKSKVDVKPSQPPFFWKPHHINFTTTNTVHTVPWTSPNILLHGTLYAPHIIITFRVVPRLPPVPPSKLL